MTRVNINSIKAEERPECECVPKEHIPDLEPSMPPENVNINLNEAYDNKDVLKQIALLKTQKQDKLTAGDNITIEGNVISAAGGSDAVWGNITGNLDDQTDLKNELTGIVDRIDTNAEAIEALDTAKADVGDSYTKAEEDTKLGTKQNVLTAGDNIVISGPQNNVISATVPAPVWGNITGELIDQTDLKNRLDGIDSDVADLEQAVQDLDTEKANTSYVDSEVQYLTEFINSVSAGVTALDNNTYKKTYIDNQLNAKQGKLTAGAGIGISANNTISCTAPGFSVQVVSVLPTTGVTGVIYLVPLLGPTSQNIYNEFIWVNGQWEQIGTTQIDLSDYKVWSDTKQYIDTGDEGLQEYIDDVSSAQTVIGTQLQSHKTDTSNPHSVTKAQVGLGNVDNTSDANKPISTATQTALDGKANVGASYTKSEEDALLAGKASTTQLITGLNGKQDRLSPGEGISISGTTISSTAMKLTFIRDSRQGPLSLGKISNSYFGGRIVDGTHIQISFMDTRNSVVTTKDFCFMYGVGFVYATDVSGYDTWGGTNNPYLISYGVNNGSSLPGENYPVTVSIKACSVQGSNRWYDESTTNHKIVRIARQVGT